MKSEKDNSWEPCPPGMLQEVANSKAGSVSYMVWATGFLAIAATLAVLVSVAVTPSRAQNNIPVIKCEEVRLQLTSYIHGEIKDCKKSCEIMQHIMRCNACRRAYKDECNSCCENKTRPSQGLMKHNPCKDSP